MRDKALSQSHLCFDIFSVLTSSFTHWHLIQIDLSLYKFNICVPIYIGRVQIIMDSNPTWNSKGVHGYAISKCAYYATAGHVTQLTCQIQLYRGKTQNVKEREIEEGRTSTGYGACNTIICHSNKTQWNLREKQIESEKREIERVKSTIYAPPTKSVFK